MLEREVEIFFWKNVNVYTNKIELCSYNQQLIYRREET